MRELDTSDLRMQTCLLLKSLSPTSHMFRVFAMFLGGVSSRQLEVDD